MWNRMFRQTYGLACLSIFVAIALAACETPATPGVATPTKAEAIGDISSLAEDKERTVDLSKAFTGEELAYSVRSAPRGVVDPEITADNRSIVIRAVGPGTATITVIAANSGGSAKQDFKVTVPPPTQPPPASAR